MSHGQMQAVIRHLHRIVGQPASSRLTDKQLLQRFATGRDEAAFAVLVQRHGPLVWGACWRVLHHTQDAEDAFQATFLVLARKAAAIPWRQSVGNWLYNVAYRVAYEAKGKAARRRVHEREAAALLKADSPLEVARRELDAVLDEELHQLPTRYRAPLLLCYLEGETQDQAARHLGWSLRTLQRRLEQGRERLRTRLARRGLMLSTALLVSGLSQKVASVTAAARLAESTVRAATVFAAAEVGGAGGLSTNGVALAEGILQGMAATKLKIGTAFLLVVALIATGTGVLAHQALTIKPPAARHEPAQKPSAKDDNQPAERNTTRTDCYGDPLPAGAVARLGTVRFLHGGTVRSVTFSPDQKTLASAGDDKMIRLWDVTTGKELQRFAGHDNWVYTVTFSPDGKILASAGIDQTIRLWNVATGREIKQLLGHEKEVNSIAFSPDGKVLASGSSDKTIRLWDVGTGKEQRRCAGKIGWVGTVVFFPYGRTLVSGSYEDGIHLWDVGSGKELSKPWLPRTGVLGAALSPDGKVLATANGKDDLGTSLWEVATGTMLRKLQTGRREFDRAVFSPDGTTVATGGLYGPVRTWEVSSGKELSRSEGFESGASAMAISPDGKIVAAGSMDHRVRLWQTSTGKQIYPFEGHTAGLRSVDYGSESKTLISAGYDGTVRVWDAANAKEVLRFAPYRTNVHVPLAYSPDRQTLVSTNVDQKIHFWDLATGKERQRFDRYNGSGIAFFVFPDGNVLAADLREQVIRLYDVRTGKEIRVLAGEQERPHPVAFSPDGKWLGAVCFSKTDREMNCKLKVWSVETGAELHQFLGQRVPFGSTLAFSPDSKMIAGVADEKIYLWEIGTGKKRIKLEQGGADSLAFSPDGRTIASGHGDGMVCLWEVATGKRICRFDGHRASVFSVAFSPDGRTLSSGSEDATVLIWDLAGRLKQSKARRVKLPPKELQSLWVDLSGTDAAEAYQAMWRLVSSPKESVPFLNEQLRLVAQDRARQQERISQLIADLDSSQFVRREKATADLERLGKRAEPALRKSLAGRPSLEVRRRLERVLDKLEEWTLPQDVVLTVRTIQVLEQIGTPEAKRVLEGLARGASDAGLAQEAKASLDRLAKRPVRTP